MSISCYCFLTGSVAIVNGGNIGVAGGGAFSGQSANTLLPGNQAAEIYNTSLPFGSRMSGLLASSGRDRYRYEYLQENITPTAHADRDEQSMIVRIYSPALFMISVLNDHFVGAGFITQ